jgi:aldose 1-epimerase
MTAATHPSALELRAGALRLALRPDLGGCIAGLWHDGEPVLRSTEPGELVGPRQSACFPLAPYSNRLGYRRFRWLGRDFTTAPNFDDGYPHSLHGCAWLQPWRVEESTATQAVMSLTHRSDDHWPFAFDLTQHVELADDALTLRMTLTNIDARTQPVGLGWHPYFPRRSRSRLHLECSGRWESDVTTHLPTRRVAQAGIDADVRHLELDHCFDGVRGPARIRDERFALALESPLPYRVVYTPAQRDFFCVEPVGHVNDAVHAADPLAQGLVALAAAETLDASMTLRIERA